MQPIFIPFILLAFLFSSDDDKDAQYPKNTFGKPLKIELLTSGTFGEPRGNHFHAGLDIKTNGTTGYRLYAVKEGYISRIKVSPYGYGKAIYINHPNGYTSVYAHLSNFNDAIQQYVKSTQYQREQFAVDLYPGKDLFPIDSGEVIGFSGNSGGSAGPHLHFEIRETASEVPINPLFFGYEVEDDIPPTLGFVKATNVNQGFFRSQGQRFALVKEKTFYTTAKPLKLEEGKIALSVQGWDRQTKTTNKNGIYRIEMLVEGESVFDWEVDKVGFHETRYVNGFMDYEERKLRKSSFYNCFRLPGNQLSVYNHLKDNGFVYLLNGDTLDVVIKTFDFSKNKSEVRLKVIGTASKEKLFIDPSHIYNSYNVIDKNSFEMYLSEGSLYDHVTLHYHIDSLDQSTGCYSSYHKVHDRHIPLHKHAFVKIKPDDLPAHLRSKALIVHEDINGEKQGLTPKWDGDMIGGKVKEIGGFCIQVDTIAPEVRLLNFSSKTNTFRGASIRVNLRDNLAGIKSYNGYIDGQWVLFDYDAKRNLMTYHFDERCSAGEHSLKIIVIDEVNNKTTLEKKFIKK